MLLDRYRRVDRRQQGARASEPRCARTPRRRAARAAGTTRTCSRCRCAPPARRCSTRSSTAGSRRRRARTPHDRANVRHLDGDRLSQRRQRLALGSRTPGMNRNAKPWRCRARPPPRASCAPPSNSATGPVSANESGVSPIETNQSRLDTRPSISRRHERVHQRVPDDHADRAEAEGDEGDHAHLPGRARDREADVEHDRRTSTRSHEGDVATGERRCGSGSGGDDRARAAAASTVPKVAASPPRSLLDDVGQQHLERPVADEQEERAPTSVAHSQRARARRRSPRRGLAHERRARRARRRAAADQATAIAERANVAASTAKAMPTPNSAISAPPSAGPAKRIPNGSISSRSALAWSSSSCGTTSGTIAVKAGWNSACPTPYTTTSTTTCHSSATRPARAPRSPRSPRSARGPRRSAAAAARCGR